MSSSGPTNTGVTAAATGGGASGSSSNKPTHVTETASDRRRARELAEARQSGNAAPEIDVKTGAMINPHNPEFITRRPWYLTGDGGSGSAGPSLDHQAATIQKSELSLMTADALLKVQRDKLKLSTKKGFSGIKKGMWVEALKRGRKPYMICQVVSKHKKKETLDLKYEDGFIERNVKFYSFGKSKRGGGGGSSDNPRVRITKVGARVLTEEALLSSEGTGAGEVSWDGKRDMYHGLEIYDQQNEIKERFQQRDLLRKQKRKQELEEEEEENDNTTTGDVSSSNVVGGDDKTNNNNNKEKTNNKNSNKRNNDKDKKKNNHSDSDSDSDSDYDSDHDDGNDSEDEFVQRDADAKLYTTRLARQGGVGGAQMKVTARNLRIREDTAKYLRNLDPNSAYYDPKSRSMRDNPYASSIPGGEGGGVGGNADSAAGGGGKEEEEVPFAGDNYARISGDAISLAKTQVFAWDAAEKGVQEIHPQANPSQAELLRKKYTAQSSNLKSNRQKIVLDKYGGAEYLDGQHGLANAAAAAVVSSKEEKKKKKGVLVGGNGGDSGGKTRNDEIEEEEEEDEVEKEKRRQRQIQDRKMRFGTSVTLQEYTRDGRHRTGGLLTTTTGTGTTSTDDKNKQQTKTPKQQPVVVSKYNEDIFINGHSCIFGSYFHKGAFKWGYEDDHSLFKNSYYTGEAGKSANDEANLLKYGDGRLGSADVAQLRHVLGENSSSAAAASASGGVGSTTRAMTAGGGGAVAPPPITGSKLYGEANQFVKLDAGKVKEALEKHDRQQQQEQQGNKNNNNTKNKRGYNSMNASSMDVTEEDMEVYRLKKGRGYEDPMSKLDDNEQGETLLEYKK